MKTDDLTALLQAADSFLADPALPAWPERDADLARLRDARERLQRRFTLAVVGEFSSGKSYLLNALLGKVTRSEGKITGLLTVDINPSTATITELEFAEEESATARFPSGRTERVPTAQLGRFVAVASESPGALHDATADDDSAPTHVVVHTNSPFLRRGFIIADTPGLASLNPAHRRATLGYLPRTDAVLYLIDTQQPFSEGDAAFLGLIGEHVRAIFIVQTKIDLWRTVEDNGKQAWENARDRITARAARYAPNAEVFAVSSRDFAVGSIDDDAALRERSGFPALLNALDASLEERVLRARVTRTSAILEELLTRAGTRLQREHALLESDVGTLRQQREEAAAHIAEQENALAAQRDAVFAQGVERTHAIVSRAASFNDELFAALSSALDTADIERIRDRGKLHALVDSVSARVFTAFAREAAEEIAAEMQRVERECPSARAMESAASRLGGEVGSGAWSRDPASGIRSTILLCAIGGPVLNFVHAVAAAFAAHERGAYMKRELHRDLRDHFFPRLETEIVRFMEDLAERVGRIYEDLAAVVETQRRSARAQTLGPIQRVLSLENDPLSRAGTIDRVDQAEKQAEELRTALASIDTRSVTTSASIRTATEDAGAPMEIPFDADVYQSGLNPQRFRVAVLGALRRGKSSLINAIAGTRLLRDEGGAEAIFPIHVRYGSTEHAYSLVHEGKWHEIPFACAMRQASETPVLIEVPWKMPRELVLVHAPAFDSGHPHAEEISLAAAAASSRVIALFSRQLSEGELALYKRIAEFGQPLFFAHTIADNENPSERRTVVTLAERYLRERDIPFQRIFTISALDHHEALLAGHAPSAWNELGALRDTLETQAEEHMRRLSRPPGALARMEPLECAVSDSLDGASGLNPLRRAFARLFRAPKG